LSGRIAHFQTIKVILSWLYFYQHEGRRDSFVVTIVIFVDPETNRSYTYAQTRNAALDFAKGLKSVWEWKKGDVLALYTPNSIDTPIVTWGTLWTGGIISPANPGYNVKELAFQLKDSGAKGLVTQKALLKEAQEACKQVGIPDDRIILIGDERDPSHTFKHFTSVRNLAGTSRFRKAKINPKKDLAFLAYSSGTTGLPKGVMLSHGNIVSNVLMQYALEKNLDWRGGYNNKGDVLLAFLPFFHIYVSPMPTFFCAT
jgi:acyl-CoA synthetase (AMP-forming)/AMP-acid ligase II